MIAPRLKILILGGTGEARKLAEAIARHPEFDATISLAGRTSEPLPQALPSRFGGFGGADGLREYLKTENIAALIDATHPFAARISANAVRAAGTETALLRIERPAWEQKEGDRWQRASSSVEAASMLGHGPEAVFLAMGKLEIAPFLTLKRPALIRTVDPIATDALPRNWRAITALGPFTLANEIALFRSENIQLLVTKNSGGPATYAKIEAARALDVPVIMIERPVLPPARSVRSIEGALGWLRSLHRGKAPTERAV